jgi:hypothetical protein
VNLAEKMGGGDRDSSEREGGVFSLYNNYILWGGEAYFGIFFFLPGVFFSFFFVRGGLVCGFWLGFYSFWVMMDDGLYAEFMWV